MIVRDGQPCKWKARAGFSEYHSVIMGAVLSLKLAAQSTLAKVTERISSASTLLSQRMSKRSSHREHIGEVPEDVTSGEINEINVEVVPRTPRPVPASMQPKGSGSIKQVLLSVFVLLQVAFNCASSIVMSLGLFTFLFAYLSSGPYEWYHPNAIGVIIGSAVFVSPALVMSLAPAGIPEAVEKGWFFVIDPADCSPRMLRLMPFLSPHPCFRKGWCRHLALGLWLSILYIPIPILLVRFVVSTDGV